MEITKEIIKECLEKTVPSNSFEIRKAKRGDGFFIYNNFCRWGHGYFIEKEYPKEYLNQTIEMISSEILTGMKEKK